LRAGEEAERVTDLRTWAAWHDCHQPYELEWWRKALESGHSQDDEKFNRTWDKVREFIRPQGWVIDIGCGPRPPFAPCTVIDPLAYGYQEMTPAHWWHGVDVHALPAEERIVGLSGNTIICWNCLDHSIGWKQILCNMHIYAAKDATIAVATDFFEPFLGHPGFPRAEFMAEIERLFEVVEARENFDRQLALLLKVKK
jgi:hypothetical protein